MGAGQSTYRREAVCSGLFSLSDMCPDMAVGDRYSMADLYRVAAASKSVSEVEGLDSMTPVQSLSYAVIREGRVDAVMKAPTGSGKTLAYVVPIVERLSSTDDVSVLVLCPLRLLAIQIGAVFRRFCDPRGCGVLVLVGGGGKGGESQREVQMLQRSENPDAPRVQVVIATPGVLRAALAESAEARRKFSNVHTVVIDEAHRMLDESFLPSLRPILETVPRDTRQVLLFSATLSDDVRQSEFLRSPGTDDTQIIDAEGTGSLSAPDEAVPNVRQCLVTCDVAHHAAATIAMIRKHAAYRLASGGGAAKAAASKSGAPSRYSEIPDLSDTTRDVLRTWFGPAGSMAASKASWKAMVFVQGNAYVDVFHARLKSALDVQVFSVHGDKKQQERVHASNAFREAGDAVLVTSDASAMGMDYTGVTLIIQVGFTNRRDYIQRLGRTGRAGAEGTNVAIIDDVEFAHVSNQLVLDRSPPDDSLVPSDAEIESAFAETKDVPANDKDRKRAFRSWLGFLASHKGAYAPKLTDDEVIDFATRFHRGMGLGDPDVTLLRDKLHLNGSRRKDRRDGRTGRNDHGFGGDSRRSERSQKV